MLYLSGQIGLDPSTGEMVEGIEAQTGRALINMQEIMKVLMTSLLFFPYLFVNCIAGSWSYVQQCHKSQCLFG